MIFRVGDLVKLRGCSGKQRVTHVFECNQTISTKYVSTNRRYYDRRGSDFELLKQPKPRPMEDHKMTTTVLYKSKTTGKFGTFLTEDSDGKYVLQLAEGGYDAFAVDDLEKVCPYTIQIDFSGGGGGHFKVAKDHGLSEGEVVVIGRNFGVVKKLDTQKDNAQEPQNLRRIVTEVIAA